MPEASQESATTHWTVRPYTAREQKWHQQRFRWRTLSLLISGTLALLCGCVALLWLLTSKTVTATATRCAPAHTHKHHLVSKCTLTWGEAGDSRTMTQTLDQPGAVGQQLSLTVDGLGVRGGLPESSAELIAGALLGIGGFQLVAGLLLRHLDRRGQPQASGRSRDGLGR